MTQLHSSKRQLELVDRTRRILEAAQAMAHAASYGLVHDIAEALERNRTRGWMNNDLRVFRLTDEDEVREAWLLAEARRQARSR